jgi:hypothetical protein
MKKFQLAVLLLCTAPLGFAQLTADQKVIDFMELAGLYAKNYAPYEWKRDVIHFDLYNLKPWLDQINLSKTDLEFYDICVNYVASLQDSHDEFTLPSDFFAYLHLDIDIYDGKTLIDGIDRFYLSSSKYPFQVGDELVSVDGKATQDLVQAYIPFAANGSGNPSSRKRLAADAITFREQFFFPRAHEIGDSATIVVRRQNGNMETYTIPWDKSGTPITVVGPVGTPKSAAPAIEKPPSVMRARAMRTAPRQPAGSESNERAQSPNVLSDDDQPDNPPANPWGVWTGPPDEAVQEEVPGYMQPLVDLQNMSALQTPFDFGGFGNLTPVFNPPSGFQLRLGARSSDQFLSGTFPVGGKTVGFIRIPTMSPSSTSAALTQFATEIAFFQQNTSGLVIDVMRNGGGSLCYTESLERYLIPGPFRSIAYEIRATQFWVEVFSSSYYSAKANGAPQWVIDTYANYLADVRKAMSQNRGRTGDEPICGTTFDVSGVVDAQGKNAAFTKPILVLTDEFTLSAAEAFTMILQDAARSTTFGTRTDGGGGNPGSYTAGVYSEGQTRVTRTFVTRKNLVTTPGFPPSKYLENTGVYPDIVQDYMTKDNLLNGGKTFVTAVIQALQGLI